MIKEVPFEFINNLNERVMNEAADELNQKWLDSLFFYLSRKNQPLL